VWRQFSQETGHCITTKLQLYHTSSHRGRGVWHLQYLEWGDQGCPHNVGHFLGWYYSQTTSCASAGSLDITLAEPHPSSNTRQIKNEMANVVVQQHSHKLLKMGAY